MSQISQNSQNSPYLLLSVSPPASLTQLSLFLSNQTCCLRDKSLFLQFLPAPDTKQTWQQCLQKSVADIIYPKSGVGSPGATGPLTWEVGRGGGLAASYTRTSTDSYSTLLFWRIRISSDRNRRSPDLFSFINPDAQNGTEPPAK